MNLLCASVTFISDVSNSSFVQFQIWDFPGQIDFFHPTFDSEMIFRGCGALIFVIDAQVTNRNATEQSIILYITTAVEV